MGLLQNLLDALSEEDPFKDVHRELLSMLEIVDQMVTAAHRGFWTGEVTDDLYKRDIQVNQAERRIRRAIAVLAVAGEGAQITHALALMSLVKDAERLGDYAKNIHELKDLHPSGPGDGPLATECRELGESVIRMLTDSVPVIRDSDAELARALTTRGRDLRKKCGAQVAAVVAGATTPGEAVQLSLLCRFYKRICGHTLNLLSSLIMPLHKLDYFDESETKAS